MLRIILPLTAALIAASPALAADDSGRKLDTMLTGAAEVPGPGDSDGRGTASLRINPGQGTACYTVMYANIANPAAAHIHRGGRTVAGPVVVPLKVAAGGSFKGCATVTRELAMDLIRDPGAFYVNVHNADFPAGAIRGQLGK